MKISHKWLMGALLTGLLLGGGLFSAVLVFEGSSAGLEPAGAESPDETIRRAQTGGAGGELREQGAPDEEIEASLANIRSFWKREQVAAKIPAAMPTFRTPSRKDELEFFPCMDCHDDDEINQAKERVLVDEHESIVLDHGGGRFWCLTCHFLKEMDNFRSMKNTKIDFDSPHLLCGQCHSPRQKDWIHGGHGKRIGNWDGERIILTCTECHDPHSPSIKPKRPDPPPERHQGPPEELELLLLELKKILGRPE